jgi:hypothetical protein
MKPALLLALALLFTACASSNEFERTLPCGPGQDIEVLAGIIDPAAARESAERVMYIVEVANNSDRDLVVSSIRLEPRTKVEGLAGGYQRFDQTIEHGRDHRFEIPASDVWARPPDFSARQPGAQRVEFSALVTLSNGDAYRCSFEGRWQQ